MRHLLYKWVSPRAWRYWREIHQSTLRERDYWKARAQNTDKNPTKEE